MYEVSEINDINELAALRGVWSELLKRTPGATFFQSLEWLEVFWKHFGDGKTLRVLIVGDPEQPIGILPLVIYTERRRVGNVRVLSYPLNDWGSYYGPLGPQPIDSLLSGLQHIKQTEQHWDLLDLRWNPCESKDPAETGQIMSLCELNARRSVRTETAFISLNGGWDNYLAQKNSKWRNNLKRWKKRLLAAGDAEYQRYRPTGTAEGDDDPRWDLYDECERLAASSWQGSSDDGTTLSHGAIRDFLRDTHEAAVGIGCLDLNLLRLDDQLIAFAYNYYLQGQVYGLRVGYDPAYAKLTPGNMMYAYAIEDSFRQGDYQYDLGPGSLDCKRQWLTSIEPIVQYTYYNPRGIRAQLMKWKERFTDWRSAGTSTEDRADSANTVASSGR